MSIPTYVEGYPQDGSSLGSSKLQIRSNLDGTFETLAIDHIDNNGNPGGQPPGYHNDIHMVPQSALPGTVSGYQQLFAMVPGTSGTPAIPSNGYTQLYTMNSNGGYFQLTGRNPSSNGYAWAGGMLLQWGNFSGTLTGGSTNTITFPVAFPGGVLIVIPSLLYTTTAPSSNSGMGTLAIDSAAISTTGFGWTMITNSSAYKQFDWFAIGF
jgi:hypothetical protein